MKKLINALLLDYIGVGVGLVAAISFFLLDAKNIKNSTDPTMLSLYSKASYLLSPPPVAKELFGIGIDSKTITYLGELPIQEGYVAEVLNYLSRNGVETVGMNIQLFDIKSTPRNILMHLKPYLNNKIVGEFRFISGEEKNNQKYPLFPELTRLETDLPKRFDIPEINQVQPYDPRVVLFDHLGFSARTGTENRVSRVPLIRKEKNHLFFSLPFLTYMAYTGAKLEDLKIGKQSITVTTKNGKVTIPIDKHGDIILRYPKTEELPKVYAFNYVLHQARNNETPWNKEQNIGLIMPYYSKRTTQVSTPDNGSIPLKLINLIALNTLLTHSMPADQTAWVPVIEAGTLLITMLLLTFGYIGLGSAFLLLSTLIIMALGVATFSYGNNYLNLFPIAIPNIMAMISLSIAAPFRARLLKHTAIGLPQVNEDGTWAEYKIVKKLGSGSYGVVYHAQDKHLKRDVVLKILLEQENETAVKRLITEGEAIARISHKNVVSIYRVAEHDGYVFLVMEYAKGESLDKIIQRKGRLPWTTVSQYFAQCLAGLAAAHAQNIIHRDIKPGNIIIAEDGTAKLTDFGLAKLTDSQQHLTATEATVGTVLYMAPEQCQGGDLDERTDLYALGATMFEALTGHAPFPGSNPAEVLINKLTQDAPPVTAEVPELPDSINDLFHTILSIQKEKRFHDAKTVQEFIQNHHLMESV